MLGKLIKYDLKALAKILAPLWGVLLVMGLIFGISIRSNLEGIGNTMIVFSLVVIVAVIVAIFVMNVIVVIQRFWKGLLQEEGYLMFTLPVTTRSLILSKVISALIISCGTALVISLLGVEIIAISPVKLMDTVTYFGNWVIKVHAGPWIGYGAVIAVVGLLSGIYHIYAAMVIGQLSNGNRFLFAFVAYAVLSIIVSLIGIPSMTNLDNMGSSLQNTFGFDGDLWIYLVENIVIIIVYHIVTEVILTKKLMKYDLKYYRKIMLPLWAVLIIYGIVHGINTVFNYETFYDHIPIKAQAIVVVTGIYFIFCVNIILVIQRFWKSMYGKESYLTHTLPVTVRKLILSKVFSAIIISFTTVFIFFAENDILIYIQSIVYHGEASLQGIPIRHFQDFTKTKVVLTILYMIIYGIIWTMHLIYQAYTAICIGQMRSKNRFATMIIVGAFLFLVGYEMQVVLLQHNRYYSWFYLPCLIAFLVEIVLCHLVIEFILTRKLNIN